MGARDGDPVGEDSRGDRTRGYTGWIEFANACGVVLELDRFGDLAGFWLIDIPPCPLLS